MCLDYKETRKEMEKSLEDLPKKIIVYKAVEKSNGKYYPTNFQKIIPYKKISKILTGRNSVKIIYATSYKTAYYRPYYHLWMDEKGARNWWIIQCSTDGVVVKCEVNKKDITDIGWQNGYRVLIATKFKILGEVKCV